jgi:drug/metabolite transporter (DMT)-like permease
MNKPVREESGRRVAATVSMFVAVVGLLLLAVESTPVRILGGILLVVGAFCEAVLSVNVFLRRVRRRLK